MSETTLDISPVTVEHDHWAQCECGARYTGSHNCGRTIEGSDEDHATGCPECGCEYFDLTREDRAVGRGEVDEDGDLLADWQETEYGHAYALCENCGNEWQGSIY